MNATVDEYKRIYLGYGLYLVYLHLETRFCLVGWAFIGSSQ